MIRNLWRNLFVSTRRVHFDSDRACVVIYEPSWFARTILRREPYEREADRSGFGRTWYWTGRDRCVPDDVEQEIERAWDRLSPRARATFGN